MENLKQLLPLIEMSTLACVIFVLIALNKRTKKLAALINSSVDEIEKVKADIIPTTSPREKKLLTRKEAADYLGLAESTLANWVKSKPKLFNIVKIDRKAMYDMEELEALKKQRLKNH